MVSVKHFEEDLAFGEMVEDAMESIIVSKLGPVVDRARGKGAHSAYDIKCQDGSVEVKGDMQVSKTGNFFIEFECSGKPSGIRSSKSDWYLLVNGNDLKEYYMIETEKLRQLVKTHKCRVVRGGDDYRAKGYLLSRCLLPGGPTGWLGAELPVAC